MPALRGQGRAIRRAVSTIRISQKELHAVPQMLNCIAGTVQVKCPNGNERADRSLQYPGQRGTPLLISTLWDGGPHTAELEKRRLFCDGIKRG